MFTLQYKWRRNVRSLALALASWVMSLTPSLVVDPQKYANPDVCYIRPYSDALGQTAWA